LVIAAVIDVTGLVMTSVTLTLMVPPLFTVLVLVVCANADPQVKEMMATAIRKLRKISLWGEFFKKICITQFACI
jgi:hypothetical protein